MPVNHSRFELQILFNSSLAFFWQRGSCTVKFQTSGAHALREVLLSSFLSRELSKRSAPNSFSCAPSPLPEKHSNVKYADLILIYYWVSKTIWQILCVIFLRIPSQEWTQPGGRCEARGIYDNANSVSSIFDIDSKMIFTN